MVVVGFWKDEQNSQNLIKAEGKREKTQVDKIRNERGDVLAVTTDRQRVK